MENEVKEAALKYNYIGAEEYLDIDRSAEGRYELHEGILITMTGVSLRHSQIESNLLANIGHFLKGKPCEIYPGNLRLKTPGADTFTYPDCMVICGIHEMLDNKFDNKFDTVTNPSVIIEVLSPSTENIDMGRKFFYYMRIPSLKEYILISSIETHVSICRKQPDNSWKFEEYLHKEGTLFIQTINYNLPLTDLYERIEF